MIAVALGGKDTLTAGWQSEGAWSAGQGNATDNYDTRMRDVTIVGISWMNKDSKKELQGAVRCVGYSKAKDGSRSVEDSLNKKPEAAASAAAVTSVSRSWAWVAGITACVAFIV